MNKENEKNYDTKHLQDEIDQEISEIEELLKNIPNFKPTGQRRQIWPSLEETLARAGWTADRSVDVSEICSKLSSIGVSFHTFAKEFISSYNYLTFYFPKKNLNKYSVCKFDALWAADHYVEFRLEEDQSIIGHQLCPIGVADHGMTVLLIDDIGRMFASIERKLFFLANTVKDGFEKLNRNERFEPVDE
ncbi:MAG: SUKH-3 domain-containing protein [Deinococcaceae bacterium]